MATFNIPALDKPTTAVIVVDESGQPVSFGGGGGPSQTEITNPGDIAPGIGGLNAGAYGDDTGAGDGSVIGLLKGIYVQNAQVIALLTQIEANTNPNP